MFVASRTSKNGKKFLPTYGWFGCTWSHIVVSDKVDIVQSVSLNHVILKTLGVHVP